MTGKIRVIRVPECGYIVLGRGTYGIGNEVDVSKEDEGEVNALVRNGYIEYIQAPSEAAS